MMVNVSEGWTYAVTRQEYSRSRLLRRGGRRGGRLLHAPVGDLEPLRELLRRGVGRLTIERHHRRRQAGHTSQLRPPPIADGRDFDLVRTPANDFVEAMNVHVCGYPCEVRSGVDSTRRRSSIKRRLNCFRNGRE